LFEANKQSTKRHEHNIADDETQTMSNHKFSHFNHRDALVARLIRCFEQKNDEREHFHQPRLMKPEISIKTDG
jgi:hypothetical protein